MMRYLIAIGFQLLQSLRSSVKNTFAALDVISFLSSLELNGYSQRYSYQTSH